MDPTGAGRLRGFRAPSAEEAEPSASSASAALTARVSGSAPPGPVGRGTGWRWLVAAAGVLVVAMVVIAALAFKLGSSSATSADQASETPTPTPAATATPLPVPDLYRQVVPSVVLITTSKGSLGSGTVVTDTGTVLTAHHVVSGGGDISILFADGTKAAATVASADPKIDIATLIPEQAPRGRGPGDPRWRCRRRLGRGGHRQPAGAAGQHDHRRRFRAEPHDQDQGRAQCPG